jgi:archaemetzincin
VSVITLLSTRTADPTLVDILHAPLAVTFGARIHSAACDIDLEDVFDPGRVQYNSSSLIVLLRDTVCAHAVADGKVLAVVSRDLFVPILTYVFGEAELGGTIAVISYHRLQNQLYGLPPDPALLASRLRKEAIHELGHTFGLLHCPLQSCVMHTSTTVEDIDLKEEQLCHGCRREYLTRQPFPPAIHL